MKPFLISTLFFLGILVELGALFGFVLLFRRGVKRRNRVDRVKGYILLGVGTFFALTLILPSTAYLYTEELWYAHLGYSQVFWKLLLTRWKLFFLYGSIAAGFMLVNLFIARAICPVPEAFRRWADQGTKVFHRLIVGVILLIAIIFGIAAVPFWQDYLMNRSVVEVGDKDPIFNKDIGFYMFSLRFKDFSTAWTKALIWISAGLLLWIYNFYSNRDPQSLIRAKSGILYHGTALWIIALIISITRSRISIWKTLYSSRGTVYGVGYAEAHALIPALKAHIIILALLSIVLLINLKLRKRIIWVVICGVWVSSYLLGVRLYPFLVQEFRVKPTERVLELEYLSKNIEMTRKAYGLDKIEEESGVVSELATLDAIRRNQEILDNIQLWDRKALYKTLTELQELRPYYSFYDVDIDRYVVNGEYRQVMIGAREMNPARIPPFARTWVNMKLKYTHGYGVVVVPVNEFTPEGRPNYWVKDIPPITLHPEFTITQPEIYFGEMTKDHIFVNTGEPELDYSIRAAQGEGEENVYTFYKGRGGVPLGRGFRRLAFMWRFAKLNVILSKYLQPQSRVMYRRAVLDRIQALAPFLMFDKDPYIVVGKSGKLWWIVDAFTYSKHYPYSEPYPGPPRRSETKYAPDREFRGKFNYIRNSVQAMIDAYNGDVYFFIRDETDPMVQVYKRIFPGMLRPQSEIPDGLIDHGRFPDILTLVLSRMYAVYHMQDPQVFYGQEDKWELPLELYYTKEKREMVPYYATIRLPGEEHVEFVNMMPFTPTAGKRNLIAWLVARCDAKFYGRLKAYILPKGSQIDGPEIIEDRIDQDPEMSQQLSLWDTGGSSVIRGNVLTIPVEDTLFYVEPIYLQAKDAKMPELKQVVVAASDKLAWGANFMQALEKIFIGQTAQEATVEEEQPRLTWKDLAATAITSLENYKKLMGEGKIKEAAEAFEQLDSALKALLQQAQSSPGGS
jgi:hypothetical protein